MGIIPQEGLLTQSQLSLLDELASVAAPPQPTATAAKACETDGVELEEAFHRRWRQLRMHHREAEEGQKRSRWAWIEQIQGLCSETCDELSGLLGHLSELDEQRKEVVRMTTALHEKCEQMVQDQERLSSSAATIAERLDVFDRVADVARILDQGNAATSHPDFGSVLDQLDGSIAFLESHYDFCQAQAYLHQFEHLRNRSCISMRSAVQKSLEKSLAQVEQQVREKGDPASLDTQIFYQRFRAAALNYKPLTTLLAKRVDAHETYAVTLEELEAFYVHLRIKLVSPHITAHLQTILHKELQQNDLAPATRESSTYILDMCHWEKQCFEGYFELRQPQEALRTLLETVADGFYKTLRPVILSCDNIDSLREIADCLQMDIIEQHQPSSKADLVPVLTVVYRLHQDVQEKLIFRVQSYIRSEIKGYDVVPEDMCYPGILFSLDPTLALAGEGSDATPAVDFQSGQYPTLRRTLDILAKIYRVLELSTFQGLAQETVDLCIGSLKNVSFLLSQRAIMDRTHAMAPLVQTMDSQLFLVKHLLILREQVAAFECDLIVSEKYFNFSNVWEALQLKLPDGLLGILKPKLHQSQVDSKKDIEAELKSACETLITNVTAHITQPLASLNNQIGEFLSYHPNERHLLKDQPFMSQDRMREIIGAFLSNVNDRVPFAAAHIRLYLATPTGTNATASTGSRAVQSTPSILFKPVQIRLVDTWGRLEGLLDELRLTSAELDALGFMRPERLRELVGSLFDGVMEAPWASIVDVVSQVARSDSGTGRTAASSAPAVPAAPAAAAAPSQNPSAGSEPAPAAPAAQDA